jgi:hypothetical protein
MFVPLAVVIALLAAWSAYWLIASSTVRNQFKAERDSLARQGFTLMCASEDWGGYPFRFEFTCSKTVLEAPFGGLRTGSILLVAQAYDPWHVIALADGPTEMKSSSTSARFTHERALISINFRDRSRLRLSAEIPNLSLVSQFSAARASLHARGSDNGRPELAIEVYGLDIAVPGKPKLRLDEAALITKLVSPREAEVESAVLRQGQVTLKGSGRLEINGQHQLLGKLATETNDIDGLLATVDPYVDLNEKDRSTVKTLFGLLGSTAKADLIFKEGEIYWGPFRIGELAPLY